MYALAFDFDTAALQTNYAAQVGPSWTNAYKTVEATLTARGFHRIQGSLYHLDNDDMPALFLAIQDLMQITWFPPSVRDIRAYRIEQWSDFTAVVKGTVAPARPSAPAATPRGSGRP